MIASPPAPVSYQNTTWTEIQQDTEFALELLVWLGKQKYPWDSKWSPDLVTIREIADACQIAESTQTLGLYPIRERLTLPALDWLANLSVLNRPRHTHDQLRTFPNRFKTLALLERFASNQGIREDFNLLCRKFERAETKIINAAPTPDFSPELVTMTWLDTLLHLHRQHLEILEWQSEMQIALDAVEEAFFEQITAKPKPTHFILNGVRDLSYAMDLLLRAGRLHRTSEEYARTVHLLANKLRIPRPPTKRDIRELYCALQLATHAQTDPNARDAVAVVIRDARAAAQSQSGKTQLTFSVLLLRLLTIFHGDQLRDVIEDTLWERSGNAKDHSARQEQQIYEQGLKRMLQSHFEVQLGRPEILAEGATRKVYRQHFRYQFGIRFASDSAQHDMPLDVIIKQDKLPALLRAAEAYNNLAEPLKSLFAIHGQPETIDGKPDGVWFLFMHDLQGYRTLSQSLDDLDRRRRPLPSEQIKIDQLLRSITRGLRALHSHSQPARQDIHDLDNEYLAPIHRQWGELSHNAFPRLRQLMYGDFRVNDQPFKILGYYLSALRQAEAKLRRDNRSLAAPQLNLIHGDCHSRNVMLNDTGELKFIDLENLDSAQDYLKDYAILFEDVGMYRYAAETDVEQEFSGKSNGNSRVGKFPTINYAPFAPSPFAHAFQEQLMEQLRAYALEIEDKMWKPRLWLAIAGALTLFSSRRFSQADKVQHQPEQEKLAMMLYTETTRLLDQLVNSLKTNSELPKIPFPGAPRSG